jgi:hypothetical protein
MIENIDVRELLQLLIKDYSKKTMDLNDTEKNIQYTIYRYKTIEIALGNNIFEKEIIELKNMLTSLPNEKEKIGNIYKGLLKLDNESRMTNYKTLKTDLDGFYKTLLN